MYFTETCNFQACTWEEKAYYALVELPLIMDNEIQRRERTIRDMEKYIKFDPVNTSMIARGNYTSTHYMYLFLIMHCMLYYKHAKS